VQQVVEVDGQWCLRSGPLPPWSSQQPPIDADELTSSGRETKGRDALRFIEARAE